MEIFIMVLEIIGTIAFAVSGALTGMKKNMDIFGVIILAETTAVGGGIMRDIMAGNPPYVFVKHFYACASIIGALLCVYSRPYIGSVYSMFLGTAAVILLRFLAARFRWSLPKPR